MNTIYIVHVLVAVILLLCVKTSSSGSAEYLSKDGKMIRCIAEERKALLLFKKGVANKHDLLQSWNKEQEEDCCKWKGVGCDNRTGHVTQLHLSSLISPYPPLNLSSLFSPYSSGGSSTSFSIGNSLLDLPYLKYLDLSNNYNHLAEIPVFIGSLTNLVHLDLSGTVIIRGSIPYQITNLSNLQYLDLSHTHIKGSIPYQIGNLSNLQYLDLSFTYIVGSIPYQIGNLSNLQYLNLNFTSINSSIPVSIGSLNSLTYLDLHSIDHLTGVIPPELGNLSKLRYLNLGFSYDRTVGHGNMEWLFNLSSLTYLDLSTINFNASSSMWSSLVQRIPSISVMHMTECNLSGPSSTVTNLSSSISELHLEVNYFNSSIFYWLSHLRGSLTQIDLSTNMLDGSIPHSFGNMTVLTNLDLSENQLNGPIPHFFGNMSALTRLHLQSNQLHGPIPHSFGNMIALRGLQLSENQITGVLPQSIFNPSNFTGLQSFGLRSLGLSSNYLSGSLPNCTGISSLEYLYLDDNTFSGSVPDFTGCSSLQEIVLGNNQLTEWKSQSTGLLFNLTKLDLSMNSIHSTISEAHLSNLSSLDYLDTSSNPLKFELNSEWLPPFQLSELHLASCKLGPKFPNWIRNQRNLDVLDTANSQISDTIPLWFWNISINMTRLNFSSNRIRGNILPKYVNIKEIDLSSNHFDGPLPAIPAGSWTIDLSQNNFSGSLLSLSAGEDTSWSYLDISHNQLSGAIPHFWMHFQGLVFLNLGYNSLTGRIPKSIGHLVSLQTLILRNNMLYGKLPVTLRKCSSLGFIDFGFNKLSGRVPSWIGEDLIDLDALILKSNRFYGRIPPEICYLSNLHFLDLSINIISGTILPCFGNLTAMIQNGTEFTEHSYLTSSTIQPKIVSSSYFILSPPPSHSYYDDVWARWKGQEREYRRNFGYLKMIDLSTNNLTGEIPIEITRLVELNGLNLSGNAFYGKVPSQIGRLKKLESLDLSINNFSGKIPPSMSGLTFLAYLNISNNNFSGRIPSGTQFQTFNKSSYEGNTGLCGKPLPKICPGDEPDDHVWPSSSEYEDGDDTVYDRWFYVSAVLGFSTTFWGIIGTLVLNRRWRHAYFLFLTNLKERIYVAMAVRIARWQRKI